MILPRQHSLPMCWSSYAADFWIAIGSTQSVRICHGGPLGAGIPGHLTAWQNLQTEGPVSTLVFSNPACTLSSGLLAVGCDGIILLYLPEVKPIKVLDEKNLPSLCLICF